MQQTDVIVVGGGPAGMSAALVLGRSRKRVVVVDGEQPRHGVADGVHNLLGHEGINPWELRRVARPQILAYPGTSFERGWVERLEETDGGVIAHTTLGPIRARAALLALGVRDQHPAWPGFAEIWGKTAHHCPYCHGWESRDQALGYVARDSQQAQHALLLRGWTDDLMVFTDGQPIDDATRQALDAAGVPLVEAPIVALAQRDGQLEAVELEGGQRVARRGLFVRPDPAPVALVASLGLEMDGAWIKVDKLQKTSAAHIWAAGDCATMMQSVAIAAAQGMMAGAMINAALTLPAHP